MDGAKIVAKAASSQGVPVFFQEYEAMPHCFMWVLADSPQYRKCWDDWTNACKSLLAGVAICSGAQFVYAKDLQVKNMDIEALTPLTVTEARELITEAANKLPVYTGQRSVSSKL